MKVSGLESTLNKYIAYYRLLNIILGGGLKYVFFCTPTWANDPIWIVFFKWVETTNLYTILCRAGI